MVSKNWWVAVSFALLSLLTSCVVKFRSRRQDGGREPAPVYESNQVGLAWTVVPVLIVLALLHDLRSRGEREA